MTLNRRNLLIVLGLLSGAATCIGLMLHPRPVTPLYPPALVLDRQAVLFQLQQDRKLAQSRVQFAHGNELEALFLQSGRAERELLEDSANIRARRNRVAELVAKQRMASGPQSLMVLRSTAVERFESILNGDGDPKRQAGLLGSFPNLLAFHKATVDAQPVAPLFVVRTLYKARWNTLHGLDHTDGFTAIEAQAYFGWLALHADRIPLPQRLAALRNYAAAGGQRVDEAAGVLHFAAHQYAEAAAAFQRACASHPSPRLRNHRLAAELAQAGRSLSF